MTTTPAPAPAPAPARYTLTYNADPIRTWEDPTTIILRPFGYYGSFHVWEDGRLIGTVSGSGDRWIGKPEGAGYGTFFFPTRDAAVEACRSYVRRGWWQGEV